MPLRSDRPAKPLKPICQFCGKPVRTTFLNGAWVCVYHRAHRQACLGFSTTPRETSGLSPILETSRLLSR